jgi:hypothetical protein
MAMVRPDLRGNPLCALAIVSRFEGRNSARRAGMRLTNEEGSMVRWGSGPLFLNGMPEPSRRQLLILRESCEP